MTAKLFFTEKHSNKSYKGAMSILGLLLAQEFGDEDMKIQSNI